MFNSLVLRFRVRVYG